MITAIDTETLLFRPGMMAPPIVCMSWANANAAGVMHRTDVWPDALAAALKVGIVGHHTCYDMACAATSCPDLLPAIFTAYDDDKVTDTLIREKLSDIAKGQYRSKSYSLQSCVKVRLGIDLEKSSVRLRYQELWDVPCSQWPEAFTLYARTDAEITRDLYAAQDGSPDEYRQARAALWIQLMSVWGIRIDQNKVREILAQLHQGKESSEGALKACGFLRANGKRDTKKAAARLVQVYAEQGKDYPRTDSGAPSLNREACQTSGDPDLIAYADYSRYPTMIAKVQKMDLPILHPRVESLVRTGRTSSGGDEENDAINSQNFSRDFGERECLIPREGRRIVVADYTMLELFTWAQVCKTLLGRSAMAEALNRGEDPHMMIAAEILGKPLDWCRANKKDKAVFRARQCGKVVNFGKPGGLGAGTLVHYAKQSWQVDLTEEQARDLIALHGRMWPEIRPYLDLIARVVETKGCIEQLFSGRLRAGVEFCSGANTLFQGLGADIAKAAGWEVCKACYLGAMAPARIILFAHDEFVLEAPAERAEDIGQQLRSIMKSAAAPWLPDVHTIDAEVRILERYSK